MRQAIWTEAAGDIARASRVKGIAEIGVESRVAENATLSGRFGEEIESEYCSDECREN
jgi:hypothetical protein